MTRQHTQGPWKYEPESSGGAAYIVARTGWVCDFVDEPNEANARLMAAAPELLEALKRIEGATMSMYATRSAMLDDCKEIARAAVAKVEGRS